MPFEIRPSVTGEETQLRDLWKIAFGDGDEYLDCFFENMFSPEGAIVAADGGKIASSVFLLPLGYFKNAEGAYFPCTVSYAFSTLPEYRRRGLGQSIAAEAVKLSFKSGFSVNTICPAEDSLFDYYRSKVGYTDYFYAAESTFLKAELPISSEKCGVLPISADEYNNIREGLLARCDHVAFSREAMAYQEKLCKNAGGNLFAVDTGGVTLCLAAERREDDRSVFVKELLAPPQAKPACVKLLSGVMDSDKYFVRCPAGGMSVKDFSVRRFAMLQTGDDSIPLRHIAPDSRSLPWFGFAFD